MSSVGIFVWGDVVEDYLDSIGVTLDDFARKLTGGWLFGYVDALKAAGTPAVIFAVSGRHHRVLHRTHEPTNTPICILPATPAYRAIRKRLLNPYAWDLDEAYERVPLLQRPALSLMKALAPYVSTPLRTFSRELARHRCSAILCQEYEYPRFDACIALGKLRGLRVFATFQGGNARPNRIEDALRPLAVRGCDGLVIGSSEEAHRVATEYNVPRSKIARLPNPLDVRLWYPVDRAEARLRLGLPLDAEIVINHGRTELHRKGLDVLLEAWRLLSAQRPDRNLRLLLVGTGNDARRVSELLGSMQLRGVIRVDEFVLDREKMRDYLASANAYVLPSRHEGFPVAPLEAMACGIPVVATRLPAVLDVLPDGEESGGLTVPPEAPEALAAALGALLDDPGRALRLGRTARKRVLASFSIEAVGRGLEHFLFRRTAPA